MKSLIGRACTALLAAASLALLLVATTLPALAQTVTPAPAATNSVADLFLTGVLAFVPSLIISVWAWFKAHAAASSAKWDDEAVAFVRQIAQGVVDGDKPPAGAPVTDH